MTSAEVSSLPPRNPSRWCHSQTKLDDLAIITWAVDPNQLAQLLPGDIKPIVFPITGEPRALVSVVAFKDRDFHFNFCPPFRMSAGQANYRAYVHRNGLTGVWFLGTSLDHPLVAIPKVLWRMPWHRDRIYVKSRWNNFGDFESWQFHAHGTWGSADIELSGTGNSVGVLSGVEGNQLSQLIVNPFRGWFRRTDGRTGRYSVWDEPMQMAAATIENAESAVFQRLQLIEPSQPPVDARVIKYTEFDVQTPPRWR